MSISRLYIQTTSLLEFSLLFIIALPFAVFGTILGYQTISTVISAKMMQAWPTVPANLQSVKLESTGSRSQRVVASYGYSVNGQQFTGKRVTLYGADNLGSFQKRTYDVLQDSLSRQEPFPVHVNPNVPGDSILMPVVRWEVTGFSLIFVVAFGGVGWGLLIASFFGCKRLRMEKRLVAQYPNEPWRQRVEWSTTRIKSTQDMMALGTACLAVLWNVFAWPMLFAVPEKLQAREYVGLLLMVFPLLGVGFVYWAAVTVARARRFGRTYLELDTFPVRQGEQLCGRVYAPAALGDSTAVDLVLSCDKHYRVSGSRTGSSTRTETLWKNEATSKVVPGRTESGEAVFNVEFEIPKSLPDSSRDSNQWYTWQLAASAVLEGADFEAEFEVPVYKR